MERLRKHSGKERWFSRDSNKSEASEHTGEGVGKSDSVPEGNWLKIATKNRRAGFKALNLLF